ncbi:MAG: taurine dioxygenase [Betaproteobacteria bacterium HGW-Betaproteobacteria-22]|nr:MAG: taurine dioxygenase [Betaproteobacteria bacterium HGW-Betaproteobacteria-22]
MSTIASSFTQRIKDSFKSSLSAQSRRKTQKYQSLSITPTEGAVGAVVTGVDVSKPLKPWQILALKKAFQEHLILIFKDQTLTDKQYLDFAAYFGNVFYPRPDVPVLASDPYGNTPAIVLVANVEGGYTGTGELTAHTDHHWTPNPSRASFLYALEVPATGGDTYWSNQYQVYDDLDDETKARIEHLQLITYNPFVRKIKGGEHVLYRNPVLPPISEAFPHPLAATHPETGKKFLYLDAETEVELVGVAYEEGSALIAKLRAHQKNAKYFYKHQWSVGDIVLWDNYATLHYRPAFDPNTRRVLKRISLAGGRPF